METNCKLVLPLMDRVEGGYILLADFAYYSTTFKKWCTAKQGYFSDGASGKWGCFDFSPDYMSASWLIHDVLCATGKWDDGTPVYRMQAALVLKEIMLVEHRPVAARTWWFFTGPVATAMWGNVLPREG